MGIFGRKTDPEPVPAQPAPARTSTSTNGSMRHSGGLFSRGRNSSPDTVDSYHSTGGSPNNRTSSLRHQPSTTSSTGTGNKLFHRNRGVMEDPSIAAARERVIAAEQAEKEADRALHQSRLSVRAARDEVKRLEAEAAEDARRARLKQQQAKDIGDRAKPLGRHGMF